MENNSNKIVVTPYATPHCNISLTADDVEVLDQVFDAAIRNTKNPYIRQAYTELYSKIWDEFEPQEDE